MIQSALTPDYEDYKTRTTTKLKENIILHDFLVDRLIHADVARIQNDDTFFVFEDTVRNMILFWLRDEWIGRNIPKTDDIDEVDGTDSVSHMAEFKKKVVQKSNEKSEWTMESQIQPPNGLLPFRGLSIYAMPVCYLHAGLDGAYMMFRELYVRYFHPLHTLSPHHPSLLTLSTLFESLFKQTNSKLYLHLFHTISSPPHNTAFGWIMFGFIGYLDIEQTLLLWDRIIGFEGGLELVAVLAVGVFLFYEERLVGARTEKEAQYILSDLSELKVVPLIQYVLFVVNNE
ncbi:hypothetical protein HK097_004213 [Rhizophlyctis rosea]|uniref:Rab-GAP TBC domain-containing protein n=1 Tax=Rhizophlyctis rosea TaxID=64517 RepID=A0AAD5SG76_9FUNG|nr:hypothetical protein HK097_004213 [Rhizophlyctis rosea]